MSYLSPALKYLKPIDQPEKRPGMEPIDCVYVINLDERPEKWERMQKLLAERGIEPTRVSAINGWNLSQDVLRDVMGPSQNRLSPGAIGCYLSHFSVYKDALERSYKLIWVLEDDADFIEDIRQIPDFLERLAKIDPKWDIFYTDVDCRDDCGFYFPFVVERNPRPERLLMPLGWYSLKMLAGDGIFRIHGRYGATSMLISRHGLEKIVDYLSHTYIATAIDCDLHFVPRIHEYVPTKEIVTNLRRDRFSDTKHWSTLNPAHNKK